ncbi:electron transport protein [Alkalihalobacillus sp. MEB130]|uniref:electron transport protein n=1 Tax=Alkalihalobacillus sp. MEB130 TaxID=2976704 RepID=UPI0028DDC27F|nr:electron transport protein [Alkalihalobacillus sp. MEB130]
MVIIIITFSFVEFEYGYVPDDNQVINKHVANFNEQVEYDVIGQFISPEDVERLKVEKRHDEILSADNGAVRIDDELINLGKELFYTETFGNEVFLTDILGFIDGPLGIPNIMKAILSLKGEPTTNLRVELSEDVTIGKKSWKKGEKIDTGLDVAKGAITPLGIPISYSKGRVRAGLSCAACHASVDLETGKVLQGVPNVDFDSGMLVALSTNSAAFFPTAEIEGIQDYIRDTNRTITNSKGEKAVLPDPVAIEEVVDKTFSKWPKGNFDTSADLTPNPTQTPDVFTLGDHPYSWNGFSIIGPFKGLSTFNNKVHSFNSDTLSLSEHSEVLLDIDKEIFIGTILQNAANKKYRYNTESGMKPSEFLKTVDTTPNVPGINEGVKPATFPKLSMVAPNGSIVTSIGSEVGKENNALSAFQNSLVPPVYKPKVNSETKAQGREVFSRAGCISCHSGRSYTNNKIIPVEEIKTEPTRAKSMKGIDKAFGDPLMYAPNTPTPLPPNPKVLRVPIEQVEEEQRNLAFAIDSNGGYKVKGLIGLAFTAPYLHDGGVAVGKNGELGIPGTVMKGILPDPYNSLKALIDKDLRQDVIDANKSVSELTDVHVEGIGHEFWVDRSTGFTEEEQAALLDYLLSSTSPEE